MQRPPLFESDSFIYWNIRFETYVKSKDLDLWHVITNGDFQPIQQNPKTKLDEEVFRALHPKWRAKVTVNEESKDLTSLSLDELIGNLKVQEMVIKKDSEIVRAKVERKSLALKAKKESSNEEYSTSRNEDEEYDMPTRRPESSYWRMSKPLKDKNQRAFVGGSWSDSGEDDGKFKNKTCLVAQASSEICLGVDLEPDEWIKDSRSSKDMTDNRKLFTSYKSYNKGNVILGTNLHGNIIGKEYLSMNMIVKSLRMSYRGNCYTLVIIDDYSRLAIKIQFALTSLISSRSDAAAIKSNSLAWSWIHASSF
uniref:DUF4219 domain-containing protein/UBN2 domain-containing protein n=1 Tax=Tanacetum cinerariifolium TaxID=118510 RepID=A0A699HWK8_TANCI|nr:hypothetical protein [Tanacetum cinerariifolium]